MDVKMIDGDLLASGTPEDVGTYLQVHGWTQVYRDRAGTAWSREDDDELELWVPRSQEMRGYKTRISQLLEGYSRDS